MLENNLKNVVGTIWVVAFIGHRKVERTKALVQRLQEIIITLIEKDNVDTFLFCSRSEFDNLCYETVSKLKEINPYIKRVYVRAEYEYIDKNYTDYLLSFYEKTFFPDIVHGAGLLSYVVRNQVMVDMSDILVVYCDVNYNPSTKTKRDSIMAAQYAQKKKKHNQLNIISTSVYKVY